MFYCFFILFLIICINVLCINYFVKTSLKPFAVKEFLFFISLIFPFFCFVQIVVYNDKNTLIHRVQIFVSEVALIWFCKSFITEKSLEIPLKIL